MEFTKRLYNETKHNHILVDKHSFVEKIKIDKLAGDLYINFNKCCINHIQQNMIERPDIPELTILTNIHLESPDILYDEFICFDNNENYKLNISKPLSLLLEKCKKYPLEHYYMFILGLLAGGNMLKKYIDDKHDSFLTFKDPKESIIIVKNYLNNKIKTNVQQEAFINIVNDSYILIKECFDHFFNA